MKDIEKAHKRIKELELALSGATFYCARCEINAKKNAKNKLLDLFMECVPSKRETKLKFEMSLSECSENEGFNRAIKETLKNIEELR